MLKIYYHNICPFSRKLRAILREKKVEFQQIEIKFWERDEHFLTLNPAAETPILIVENHSIASSYAIFEYIEEKFPIPTLFASDTLQNAEIRRVADWFDRKFYNEVTKYILSEKIFKIFDKNAPQLPPNSGAIRAAKKNVLYHLQYIDFLLQQEQYLCGPKISLADYAAAAQLSVLDMVNDVPWERFQAAKSWYALMKSRSSFRSVLLEGTPYITPPPHYRDPDF